MHLGRLASGVRLHLLLWSITTGMLTSNQSRTVRTATSVLWPMAVALSALIYAAPRLSAAAPAPAVTSVFPAFPSGYQGQDAPTVIVRGTAFQSGAKCDFGPDITVNSCTFNSSTQLTANVTVSPAASPNSHPVTVTNPDGQSGTLSNGFLVSAPPKPHQVATFSFHPSSSGTVTVPLPSLPRQRSTLIVGLSFSPADVTGVTVNELGSGESDVLKRGLATSILHDDAGGSFFTNFYYGPNHGYQLAGLGPDTLILNFSGGATNVVIAVAEVSGLACLDCGELDQSANHESLSSTASWSSGSPTTTAFHEYLFSWGATQASDSTCAGPGSGWTLESQTNDSSGAAVCLLDRFVEAPGLSHQASVNANPAANYGMEIATFAKQIGTESPPPTVTSVNPGFGAQGQTLPTVVIAGNFFDDTTVCSFGAGITVNSCALNSSTQLVASITIGATAAVGPHNVTITKASDANVGGTLANAFSVSPGGPAGGSGGIKGSVSPTSATVSVGSSADFTVNLTSTGGFAGKVGLVCSGAPSGIGCTFNPGLVNLAAGGGANSIMTVQVSAKPSISTNEPQPANPSAFPWRNVPIVGMGLAMFAALLFSFGVILRHGLAGPDEFLFSPSRIACRSRSCVAGLAAFVFAFVLAAGLISCGGTTNRTTSTSGGGTTGTAGTGGAGGTGGTGGSGGMGGTGGTGGAGGGTGGSGSAVTTQFTVQAQSSGGATFDIGTVSITVP